MKIPVDLAAVLVGTSSAAHLFNSSALVTVSQPRRQGSITFNCSLCCWSACLEQSSKPQDTVFRMNGTYFHICLSHKPIHLSNCLQP